MPSRILPERPKQLQTHEIVLEGDGVRLRPMTEDDWDLLIKWNNDPKVLFFWEGDDISGWALEDLQRVYRSISSAAYTFMMEAGGRVVGECWLQKMNLDRLLDRWPGKDLRRIDLSIGEKDLWNRGIGTEAIRLLARLGIEQGAHAIFAVEVADNNPRSLRAFEKAGFQVCNKIKQPSGKKADVRYDLVLTSDLDLLSTVDNASAWG